MLPESLSPKSAGRVSEASEQPTARTFRERVTLDVEMSSQEARNFLVGYYSEDFVNQYFSKLQEADHTIFKEAVTGSADCIGIYMYDAEGTLLGSQLFDPINGNLIARAG